MMNRSLSSPQPSHNPLLTTLAADVKKVAGLTTELNSMGSITVFAPANTAFSKLPHSTGDEHDAQPEGAGQGLEVSRRRSGHVTTAQLASGKPLTTLEGSTLKPSKMGAVYEVNNAGIICGNIPHRQRHRLHHQQGADPHALTRSASAGSPVGPRPQGCFTRTARV